MTSSEQMRAAVHTYVESYNRGDLDGIAGIYAADATVEDPVGTPLKRGHAELREFFGVGISMGAKLHLDGPIRCASDSAAFAFHVELEMEGKAQRIDVIDVFRFDEEGKVAEMRAFFGPENMGAV
ncbi:MAG: nuclear transport factor 2 family protein [Marinomonas sp.]